MPSRQQFKDLADRLTNKTFADFRVDYVFEQKTRTPDGQGGFTTEWNNFATIKGFAKVKSAKQGTLDDHIKHDYDRVFSFEYVAGITDSMRIVYEGLNYNITYIDPTQDVDVWINVYAKKDVVT